MAESRVKKEIKRRLGKLAMSHLATCARRQPRVRPMTLIHRNGEFWMATHSDSPKARQMRRNPRVEICVPLVRKKGTGYIQITARAGEVRRKGERAEIGNYCGYIDRYFKKGVEDPGYALFRMKPTLMRFMRPGEMKTRKVKW